MSETCAIEFTEEMKGFFTFGTDDFEKGHDSGKERGDGLMFRLTIAMDDIDRFIADPQHLGSASGYVESEALGGRRDVERGWFNLFVDEGGQRSSMRYRLWFTDGVGNPATLVGHKDVHDDPGFDTWSDTTTLYVHILPGHVSPEDGDPPAPSGAGVLHIHPVDFAQQLTTFRARGGSVADRAKGLAAFNKLFLGKLWSTYGRLVPTADEDGIVGGAQGG